MNTKGQSLIFGLMLMFFALIIVTIITQPMREIIDITRDAEHLNCTNPALTTGGIATCLIVDLFLPYFVGAALFLAGGYVVYKKVTQE